MEGARSLTGAPSRARRLIHALRRGLRAGLPPKGDEHSDIKSEHTRELFLAYSKFPKLHFQLDSSPFYQFSLHKRGSYERTEFTVCTGVMRSPPEATAPSPAA